MARFQTHKTVEGQKMVLESGAIMRGSGYVSLQTIGPDEDYDAITTEVDRAIRFMPGIIQYCMKKANQTAELTGSDNFYVFLSTAGVERPRAYVVPNSMGIHEELSQGLALKAAVSMSGQ
jgi:hypothetical protein